MMKNWTIITKTEIKNKTNPKTHQQNNNITSKTTKYKITQIQFSISLKTTIKSVNNK
jgi:hypothetical protein